MQPAPRNPNSFIGILKIDPAELGLDGEYIVELPRDCYPLTVGWIEPVMVMWVMAPWTPPPGDIPMTKQRLWVVPGGRQLAMHVHAGSYVGCVLIANASEDGTSVQDWHVFYDASGDPILGDAQATYTIH